MKDEKDRDRGDRDREQRETSLRESPLPPRGVPSIYARNPTDSHSSHGSDDGRAEEYNRKMLGYEKRELGNSQPNIPIIKSSNNSISAINNKKKPKDEKEESDHEKSDGELVVDDTTEV